MLESGSRQPRSRSLRLTRAIALTLLFFAGGAMSALGGDVLLGDSAEPAALAECEVVAITTVEVGEDDRCTGETTGEDAGSVSTQPELPATQTETGSAPSTTEGLPPQTPNDPAPEEPAADSNDGGRGHDGGEGGEASAGGGAAELDPVDTVGAGFPVDPEASTEAGAATLWLHRASVDPMPAARRLSPRFARRLVQIARRHRVSWPLVLGTLRAEGMRGRVPAPADRVRAVARKLASNGASKRPWAAVLAVSGRTAMADRAVAFARYNRSVGLAGLVKGLVAVEEELERRVLADPRIVLYAGGRSDISAGRVDVRVIVLLRYLRRAHGSVTVSSLVSGHRLYARPGVVSAHVYGRAVDLSALGGVAIDGHQQPGGITEQAIRSILLLPSELRPQQVISLLGLGGPSFPLADHGDHIHVGF